jgi:acyl carrier protein
MRVKTVFDRNIDFDLSRLSSTDDFSKELRFLWDYDSLAGVKIVIDLEKEFGVVVTDAEAESMKTIQKVVEIIAQKVAEARSRSP